MGGSETAQQPDKQLNERGGIGRQHVSDGCVTDAVSQCLSFGKWSFFIFRDVAPDK